MITIFFTWIVPHHEVGMVPIACIIINKRDIHVLQIVFYTDVKKPIIVFWDLSKFSSFMTPPAVVITPVSIKLLSSPRISKQEEFFTIGQLQPIKDGVGMVWDKLFSGVWS